jgi:hypothetical protein
MNDFIPSSDKELVLWATNLRDKLADDGAALGLTPAEIEEAKEWCEAIIKSVTLFEKSKANYESASNLKKQELKIRLSQARKFAKDVKRKNSYTTAIGSGLGIVGTETVFNPSDYRPEITVKAFPGYVQISFVKKGVEGIHLYTRKKGEAGWQKLNYFAHSPAKDTRGLEVESQPENREYMAIGVKKDQEIGNESKIVSVAFAG